MWSFHGLNRLFPEQASWLAKQITETYHVFPEEWARFAQAYLSLMTGADINIEEIIGKDGTNLADLLGRGLGEKFLSPMLNLILADVPQITPESGLESAERFIGVNLAFQLQQWTLHLLGDMVSFGMFKSFKDLPNAIAWTYGIGWLSWIAMGPWFQRTIADPLRWHINKTWTPEILSEGEAIKAWRIGLISRDQRDETLSRYGWNEDRIRELIELKEPNFSESELEQAWRWWGMDDDEAIKELNRRGFGNIRARWKWMLTKEEEKRKLINKIAMRVGELWQQGKADSRDLRDLLEQAGFKREEIDLHIEFLRISHTGSKLLTPGDVVDLYRRKRLDYREALNELKVLGFDEPDAEKYMYSQERLLTPADLARAYEENEISRSEYKEYLTRQLLYSDDSAELLIRHRERVMEIRE